MLRRVEVAPEVQRALRRYYLRRMRIIWATVMPFKLPARRRREDRQVPKAA